MSYTQRITAKDKFGATIRIGDMVKIYINGAQLSETECEPNRWGPAVKVVSIHSQGYDGTILHTDIAPDPDFPHHKQGAARDFARLLHQHYVLDGQDGLYRKLGRR